MAKRIGIVTGWRKLQKVGKVIRFKQRKEKLTGRVIGLDEIYLRVGGRKMWGLLAKSLEGISKVMIFYPLTKTKKVGENF